VHDLSYLKETYSVLTLYCASWELSQFDESKLAASAYDVYYTPACCFVRLSEGLTDLPLVACWRDGIGESYVPDKNLASDKVHDAANFVGSLAGVSRCFSQWIPGLLLCPDAVPDYACVDKTEEAARFADRSIAPPPHTVEFALDSNGLMSSFAMRTGEMTVVATATYQWAQR